MILLYFGGMAVGILAALVLKSTLFRGNPVPFVMELPNYRLPSPKSVLLLMWEKAEDFLTRAFTVIFMATVIIWFLQSFDLRLNVVTDSTASILASLGRLVSPLFAPLGFGDWRMVTALVSGFTAKEAVVSTFGVILCLFTTSCELCDCTCWCSFRRLSTCVRIYLCIKYHDVDIFTGS